MNKLLYFSLPAKFEKLQGLIVSFNDTFLRENNYHLYHIKGYNFIHRSRKLLNGGGVCMYIRYDIPYKVRDDLSIFQEGEFESIFIETTNNPMIIGEIFRIPNTGIQPHLIVMTR